MIILLLLTTAAARDLPSYYVASRGAVFPETRWNQRTPSQGIMLLGQVMPWRYTLLFLDFCAAENKFTFLSLWD